MKTTSNYGLKKPENTDPADNQPFNDNADMIDAALAKKLESTGKASDLTVEFSQASTRANLTSGETVKTSLGKIMKWFADLKGAAFADIANDLATATAGKALDATQGKALNDKYTALDKKVDTVNADLETVLTIGPYINEVAHNYVSKRHKTITVYAALIRKTYDLPNNQVIATIPAKYRPSHDMYRVPAILRNTGTGLTSPCAITITSSTGEISIDGASSTIGFGEIYINITYVTF